MRLATILVAWALAAPASGQGIKLPFGLERLGAKAEDKVEVTMDKAMLKFAARFLSDKGDEARARKVIGGLESIYVRSFTFAKESDYTQADVDAFRAQFQTAAWSRVLGVRSKEDGENLDVLLKSGAQGQIGGAVVIAMQPRELTVVYIAGVLDFDQLADLGGQFHIPHIAFNGGWRK